MTSLPRLRTERLLLRVPTPDDAVAMTAFVTENRDHFAPWDPERDEAYFTVAHWRGALAAAVDEAAAGTGLTLVLTPRDAAAGPPILGRCTFSGIARGPFQAAYLGYGLARAAEGRGLMTEALRAAIAHAFGPMNLHRIMANHVPANTRSAALLARLGFVREGYARAYLRLDGRWQDHVLTALTNESWQERT